MRQVGFDLNIKRFFYTCENTLKKAVVPLHSIELFIILYIFLFFNWHTKLWFDAIMVGSTVHMILDIAWNYKHPMAYFFVYRLKMKFEVLQIWGLRKS